MGDLFHNLSLYDGAAPASFPTLASYDPGAAVRGTWPCDRGSPAQTSTAGGPLTADKWSVAWEAPLGDAATPESILVGADTVIVNGADARGIWHTSGEAIATIRRAGGSSFLDAKGQRLWCDDPESGLSIYTLHDGRRDARVMLAFPTAHALRQMVQGPDVLVILTARDFPLGPPPEAVVEAVRVSNYGNKSERGIFYGLEPLGGIIRTQDADVRMAAARSGPVLATPDGLLWCDWQLRPVREVQSSMNPIALSADSSGRAMLVFERDGAARFSITPAGAAAICDVELPWEAHVSTPPAIVMTDGSIAMTPPGRLLILASDGRALLHESRASRAPATMTSNGILLLPHDQLLAVTPEGDRYILWQPPGPILTAPILAQGILYVATQDMLYALRAN
jgi:hypothetical protein